MVLNSLLHSKIVLKPAKAIKLKPHKSLFLADKMRVHAKINAFC